MVLSNFYARVFSTLETLVFFQNLVSHDIKVCSHYNFFKPFLVYVVKIMETAIRQWLEILINGFLIKNL